MPSMSHWRRRQSCRGYRRVALSKLTVFAAILCCLLMPAAPAYGAAAEQEAAALFGIEYHEPPFGQPILPRKLSCTDEGARELHANGHVQHGWYAGTAICQGRCVELLKRVTGQEAGRPRWRIEDVLLLPPLAPGGSMQRGLSVAEAGECTLGDLVGTSFLALVRWGKQFRVDRDRGLEQVWVYDLERGRIMLHQSADVACERADAHARADDKNSPSSFA